jgi:hypothetical protein
VAKLKSAERQLGGGVEDLDFLNRETAKEAGERGVCLKIVEVCCVDASVATRERRRQKLLLTQATRTTASQEAGIEVVVPSQRSENKQDSHHKGKATTGE